MQRGWIGYSTGTQLSFEILSNRNNNERFLQQLEVFTTRIDTIYGVTFVALAYDHPSVEVTDNRKNNEHFYILITCCSALEFA